MRKPMPFTTDWTGMIALALLVALVVSVFTLSPAHASDPDVVEPDAIEDVPALDEPPVVTHQDDPEPEPSVEPSPAPSPGAEAEAEPDPGHTADSATTEKPTPHAAALTTAEPSPEPGNSHESPADEELTQTPASTGFTPMSNGDEATLTLHGSAGQQPGVMLQAGGYCGLVPATGYRALDLTGADGTERVWFEFGLWDHGSFIGNVPTVGVAPNSNGIYTVTLTCNYGHLAAPTQTVTATYQTHPASVQGTVTWEDGQPARGVTARVFNEATDELVREFFPTGPAGTYGPSWFAPGSYRIRYIADNGDEVAVRNPVLFVGSEAVLDIEIPLRAPGSVEGTTAWQTGEPYADGRVRLHGHDYRGAPVDQWVDTDSLGGYEFGVVEQGVYTVQLGGILYETTAPVSVSAPTAYVVDLVTDLHYPGSITGRAEFSDGRWATGSVQLTLPNGDTRSATISSGSYTFENLQPGTYTANLTSTYTAPYGPEDFSSGDIEIEVFSDQTTVQDIVIAMPTGGILGQTRSIEDNEPLPGLTVSIPSQSISAVTDESGLFTLEPIEGAGTFNIEVRNADGDLLRSTSWVLGTPGEYTSMAQIYTHPALVLGEVTGAVTWADGSPVEGAALHLRNLTTGTLQQETTNASGGYTFTDVDPGFNQVRLMINDVPYASVVVTVANGATVERNFHFLSPRGGVEGTLTDASGDPVQGSIGITTPDGTPVAFTNSNWPSPGTFAFQTGLEPGEYLVTYLLNDGTVIVEVPVQVVAHETAFVELVIPGSVPDPGALSGLAQWADASGPVHGVYVEMTRGFTTVNDTSKTDGTFGFDELAAGPWHLSAIYDGDEIFSGPVTIPEDGTLDFVIDVPVPVVVPDPGTVSGTVTWDDGSPVDDAVVQIIATGGSIAGQANTSVDGTYEVTGLDAGAYTLEVVTDAGTVHDQAVTVTEGAVTTVDVVLPLPVITPDPGALEGLAQWADASGPVDNVVVDITRGSVHRSETTGADGVFAFSGLEAGIWTVNATHDGDVVYTSAVDVPEGDTLALTINVPVPVVVPDVGTVSGTVTWDDGSPVDDAIVGLTPTGSAGVPVNTATAPDGTYEILGVEVGDYLVQVVIDGNVAAELAATVLADETTTVNLEVPLGGSTPLPGSLHGQALWADLSGPVDGVHVEITQGTTVLNDVTGLAGTFAFAGLAPGLWHLTATFDGEEVFSGAVSVVEDQTTVFNVEVPLPASTPGPGGDPPGDDDDPVVVPGDPGDDTSPADESSAPSPGATAAAADPAAVEAAADAVNTADVAASNSGALASTGPHAQSALLVTMSALLLALGLVSVRASHRNRISRGSSK